MELTHYEKERKRDREELYEILTKLSTNPRYEIFIHEENPYGLIFDKELNRLVSVSSTNIGLNLTYTLKPSLSYGDGYHIGGLTIGSSGPHYEFIGDLSEDILTDAIQYGESLLLKDINAEMHKKNKDNTLFIANQTIYQFIYKDIDEYLKHHSKSSDKKYLKIK